MPWFVMSRTGDAASCTWRCVVAGRSRKWRWLASWPYGCIGCGAEVGTISRLQSSVRTWSSPELVHGVPQNTVKLIGRSAPAREFEHRNHGRSCGRIDGWVGPSPPQRLTRAYVGDDNVF